MTDLKKHTKNFLIKINPQNATNTLLKSLEDQRSGYESGIFLICHGN